MSDGQISDLKQYIDSRFTQMESHLRDVLTTQASQAHQELKEFSTDTDSTLEKLTDSMKKLLQHFDIY